MSVLSAVTNHDQRAVQVTHYPPTELLHDHVSRLYLCAARLPRSYPWAALTRAGFGTAGDQAGFTSGKLRQLIYSYW